MNEASQDWKDRCQAAWEIKERFGKEKAAGYLIGEKLLEFLRVSDRRPEIACEIPNFIFGDQVLQPRVPRSKSSRRFREEFVDRLERVNDRAAIPSWCGEGILPSDTRRVEGNQVPCDLIRPEVWLLAARASHHRSPLHHVGRCPAL